MIRAIATDAFEIVTQWDIQQPNQVWTEPTMETLTTLLLTARSIIKNLNKIKLNSHLFRVWHIIINMPHILRIKLQWS